MIRVFFGYKPGHRTLPDLHSDVIYEIFDAWEKEERDVDVHTYNATFLNILGHAEDLASRFPDLHLTLDEVERLKAKVGLRLQTFSEILSVEGLMTPR